MINTNYHDIKQVCCILNSIFSVHIPSMDESYKVGCYLKLLNNLKSFQLFFYLSQMHAIFVINIHMINTKQKFNDHYYTLHTWRG